MYIFDEISTSSLKFLTMSLKLLSHYHLMIHGGWGGDKLASHQIWPNKAIAIGVLSLSLPSQVPPVAHRNFFHYIGVSLKDL